MSRHRHLRRKQTLGVVSTSLPSPVTPVKTRPKIVLGAPVAERAWILPLWWEHLSKQTLQPDEYCFILSPSQDETEHLLTWPDMGRTRVFRSRLPFHSRDQRNADPKDPWRAAHLAQLRNQLRTLFLSTDGDIFISLDTDLLLEDPTTLEQLVSTIYGSDWDVVALLTYLHPLGPPSLCYNAGFWGGGEGFDQIWRRADSYDLRTREPLIKIDIPMAAYAIQRHALSMCTYKSHECGEDLGFAQSLAAHRFKVGWRTDLEARHVWGPSYLETVHA